MHRAFGLLLALVSPTALAKPEIVAIVKRAPEIQIVVASLDAVPARDAVSVALQGGYAEVQQVNRLVDSGMPVATAILVDTSSSMKPSFEDVKSALRTFVDGMAGGDVTILVPFDDQVQGADTSWLGTPDRAALTARIDGLVADGPRTHLYEALNSAVDRLVADQNDYPLRTALVLSDGADYGSPAGLGLERARANAMKHDVSVSAVGYLTGTEDSTRILQDLAKDTGGRYRFASSSSAIEGMLEEIQSAVHNLVVVTVVAESIPAGSHELELRFGEGDDATEATARLDLDERFDGRELEGNDPPDRTLLFAGLGAGTLLVVVGIVTLAVRSRRQHLAALQAQMDEAKETARRLAAEAAAVKPTRCGLDTADGSIHLFAHHEFGVRVLGTDPQRADLCVIHETVSGAHARIERRPDDPNALYVTDLGSSNGTYHQGFDIRGRATLRVVHRERLQFGLFATLVDITET